MSDQILSLVKNDTNLKPCRKYDLIIISSTLRYKNLSVTSLIRVQPT